MFIVRVMFPILSAPYLGIYYACHINIHDVSTSDTTPAHQHFLYASLSHDCIQTHLHASHLTHMHCCRMNATKCIYTPVILPLMHCQCIDTPMHRICMAAAKFRTEPPFATTLPYVMYVRVMHIISIVFLM